MQNQNLHSWSWGQGAAAPFAGGQPVLPTTFTPSGVDQNSLLASYQQMYGSSPAQPPSDYTQWSSAQFQQWQQWQQWQEKYQQWQAQYGKKYAESLAAMGQNPSLLVPGFPSAVSPMRVPKPVEPVTAVTNANPPLPSNSQPVPPPPPEEEKPPLPISSTKDEGAGSKNDSKDNPEDLSQAEKTFDIQFKQWESDFEEWKKQNQDHPDKAQYREYEKKWEAWREQLLQRLEQMRKKRLEKANEATKTTKMDDVKGKPTPSGTQGKPTDPDYGYRTQPPAVPQNTFASEPPKFENKPPLFDKPPPVGLLGAPPNNFGHQGNPNQEKTASLDAEPSRGVPFAGGQNFPRNRGPFGGFDGNQEGPNSRFGNFEGNPAEGNFNQRFRNPGHFDGPRFGNFDSFPGRRFEERNFGPPSRFPGDGYRNERDFNRGFEGEKGPFGNEGRQGPPPKAKVPSLFDIQIEKPPGLMGSSCDRKLKVWEKHDDFEKKQHEAKPWTNNPWSKNVPSPWMQPWEMEKLAAQKPPEVKPWEREGSLSDNSPWLKDSPFKRDLDRVELSGYVGNILAKLGNVNVMPSNLGNKLEDPPDKPNEDSEKKIWSEGPGQKNGEDTEKSFLQGNKNSESNSRNQNDQEQTQDRLEAEPAGRGNEFEERMTRGFDRFDDSGQFPPENRDLDIDDRIPDKFRRDGRIPLGRDDRNFARPGDRRNFGCDDRYFERGPFGRGARDDRGFGGRFPREDVDERFGGPRRRMYDRLDRDDREGRGFDRQGGGPFDRFGRHDQLNEPAWRPQVFDYSQGRPTRLTDPDDGFKISTVVDYSHGESKQTFDYGHGEGNKNKFEVKSFDYGHRAEAPTIIDYGHGEGNKNRFEVKFFDYGHRAEAPTIIDYGHGEGNKSRFEVKSFDYGHRAEAPTVIDYGHGVEPNSAKGDKDNHQESQDEPKGMSGSRSPAKRSRSPRGSLRSRSRSPHSRFKRNSVSPPFKNVASRHRDRMGRHSLRTDKNCSEEKSSPADGDISKHSFTVTTVLVEDLICRPGRESRPNKLVFIMRGLPGSGKTYVTKLIKDKEVELGGDPPRILSLDDYFMTEVEKETVDSETGRKVKTKTLEYEYEAAVEPHYRGSLVKAFKKTVSDGFFSFIIVDSVNEKTKDYEEMWSFAKQKGFQVYIAEMDNDVGVCTWRNIHKRTEKEISDVARVWEETPVHYLRLDVRSLLQSDAITEVEMEVVSDTELEKSIGKEGGGDAKGTKEKKEAEEEVEEEEEEEEEEKDEKKDDEEEDEPGVSAFVKSRWDQFENSEQNLDRLDGLKRRREGCHATMEDYLQLPDDFDQEVQDSAPGKKRVRWADLEERKQQEKMRAIGFVVGQTDWSRMTDPTFGESALTRTKYI